MVVMRVSVMYFDYTMDTSERKILFFVYLKTTSWTDSPAACGCSSLFLVLAL
jgi:hypothetical protein